LYESKGDDIIFIQADRHRVAQLVTNLLSNALQMICTRRRIQVFLLSSRYLVLVSVWY
jgi:signal transduction histidine kinase